MADCICEIAMLTLESLTSALRDLGVQSGDTLLCHSSYKSLGEVNGGPQTVIDALLSALGKDGTLIMPTFNFDFNKGEPWDVRITPSKMGILTEFVRKDARARRVFHPFYSFAVIGKHAEMLGSLRYKSAYERNSVFGKLRDLDGKIIVIGLSYNDSMTFFHHIEQFGMFIERSDPICIDLPIFDTFNHALHVDSLASIHMVVIIP